METEQRGKALPEAQAAPQASSMLAAVEAVLALLVVTQARQRLEMAALANSGLTARITQVAVVARGGRLLAQPQQTPLAAMAVEVLVSAR